MKLLYKCTGALRAKGISFEPQTEYEVSDAIGEYLLKTFGKKFEDVTPAPKPKPKAKAKHED